MSARPGAIIRAFESLTPKLHPSVWVAPGAAVIGDVEIGEDSSVFYGAVLRGDVECIRIGKRTNIQDQATLHVTEGRYSTWLGDEITVGHRAVVHGCRVGNGALIGIGAGAGVTPGTVIESGMLAVGMPAKMVRRLEQDEIALQRERTLRYVETARKHAGSSG